MIGHAIDMNPKPTRSGQDVMRERANQARIEANNLAVSGDFSQAEKLIQRSRHLFAITGDVDVAYGGHLVPHSELGIFQVNSEAELIRLREIARLKTEAAHALHDADLQRAIVLYQMVAKASKRILGREHPMMAIGIGNVGLCLKAINDRTNAYSCLSEAIRLLRGVAPHGVYTKDLLSCAVAEFQAALAQMAGVE